MGAIIYPIYGNGCGAAAGWRTSARRCTSVTARSTSPARVSCTPPAAGRRSRSRWCSGRASGSSTRTAAPNAIPGHNIPLRRDRHAGARVRLDGLQPGLDVRRDRPAHRPRRGQHAARRVRRLRDGDGLHQLPSTASPTSRCRATACSPGSSRSPRRARSSRRGRRSSSAIIAGVARRATASSSSTGCGDRRPVRRDLGARRVRRVGRARGRALRRRHVRRGWNGVDAARRARASSTATAASSARRSSTSWSGSSGRGASRGSSSRSPSASCRSGSSPEVEIAGSRRCRVRAVCYPDFVLRAETDVGVTHELDAPRPATTPSRPSASA